MFYATLRLLGQVADYQLFDMFIKYLYAGEEHPVPIGKVSFRRVLNFFGPEDTLYALRAILPEQREEAEPKVRGMLCDFAEQTINVCTQTEAGKKHRDFLLESLAVSRRFSLGETPRESIENVFFELKEYGSSNYGGLDVEATMWTAYPSALEAAGRCGSCTGLAVERFVGQDDWPVSSASIYDGRCAIPLNSQCRAWQSRQIAVLLGAVR